MRQREPDHALQAVAFRPKGSPCPFGTSLFRHSNTRDPNLPVMELVYLVLQKNARAVRPFSPAEHTFYPLTAYTD